MNKKKDINILKFPINIAEAERQVEAILFAADEPLDLESIQTRLKVKANVPKILETSKEENKAGKPMDMVNIAKLRRMAKTAVKHR